MSVPPDPLCRRCGAPAERGQEYCLECGSRLVPPRRVPTAVTWAVPSAVMLLVATAGAAAAIAATNGDRGHGRGALVAVSPLEPLPPPPPPPQAKPAKPGTPGKPAKRLISWPSTNGYTIILASLPLKVGIAPARAKALSALREGLPQVGVLVSSSYPSLHPGYYIVFSGIYASQEEAQGALSRARSRFPAAYASPIVR